jgi:hypothetical protein
MPDPLDHLRTVGEIVDELRALNLDPVLVGGMALVVLGSRGSPATSTSWSRSLAIGSLVRWTSSTIGGWSSSHV